MKKSDVSFSSIPASAISEARLNICLKCAFDLFTRQLKLAPRTAYTELRKHIPEETDFTGASTTRPHFLNGGVTHCPYCNGVKRWFAPFTAFRIDAHPSFEKERKKLWTVLKKAPERYAIWQPERTRMQIFSEWLDRLKRRLDFESDDWLLESAVETIKRNAPSNDWDEILTTGVRRVQLSRQIDGEWRFENHWLHVTPALYGDVLMVQHLLSRSHSHGGRTFEGRLTLGEFMRRLRRTGYLEARQIERDDPYAEFEHAIQSMVDSGPGAVYYAVDRSEYLEKLKAVYEKKREK